MICNLGADRRRRGPVYCGQQPLPLSTRDRSMAGLILPALPSPDAPEAALACNGPFVASVTRPSTSVSFRACSHRPPSDSSHSDCLARAWRRQAARTEAILGSVGRAPAQRLGRVQSAAWRVAEKIRRGETLPTICRAPRGLARVCDLARAAALAWSASLRAAPGGFAGRSASATESPLRSAGRHVRCIQGPHAMPARATAIATAP